MKSLVKAFVVLGRNQESVQILQDSVRIIDVFSTALHSRYLLVFIGGLETVPCRQTRKLFLKSQRK